LIALIAAALAVMAPSAQPRSPGGGVVGGRAPAPAGAEPGGEAARERTGEPAARPPEEPLLGAAQGLNVGPAEFSSWLSGSPEAARYAGAREALATMAERAIGAEVPLGAIMLRVREAAAKRVDPETLVAALELDLARWIELAASLRGSAWPPAAQAPEFFVAAGAALRNGLDAASLSELISWSVRAKAAPERVAAAMIAAAGLVPALGRSGASRAALALAASRLRSGEFDAAAASLASAAARGTRAAELIAALEDVLGRRGTLRDLERRLGRP
jgi:hypothetical protein